MSVQDWSTIADLNQSADAAINWREGQPPSSVNNSARAMMAALAAMVADQAGMAVATAVGSAITVAFTQPPKAETGYLFAFVSPLTSVGPTTMTLRSGGTPFALRRKTGVDLIPGQILQGENYLAIVKPATSEVLLLADSLVSGFPSMSKPYLGQVATQSSVPNNANQANTGFNSRSRHVMKDDVQQLQAAFPNWNVATAKAPGPTAGWGGIEHTNGQPATIRVGLEYPKGTVRQLLFSGSATGQILDGGTLMSDVCEIAIPKGAEIFFRTYWQCPGGGLVWSTIKDGAQGEAFEYGTGSIPDKSRAGTIQDGNYNNGSFGLDGGNAYVYRPIAIVAPTVRRSVLLVGDSRIDDYQDLLTNDTAGAHGPICRSIVDNFPYINIASAGDRITYAINNYTRRLALAKYCSHVVCNFGINDVNNGYTSDQIMAALKTFYAMFPSTMPIFQNTYEPYTTSSDNWTTPGGQSPAGAEAVRVACNTAIRAGIGQYATIDVADAFEDGRNSGRWKTGNPDGPLTPDGLHPSFVGSIFFKNLFHISPSLFRFY